jgi:hypothetical protein
MNWLIRLLLIDAPERSTLESAEFGLRGGFPVWIAALAFLVLSAGVVWLYFREQLRLPLARRLVLAGLRAAALGVLLWFLLRPVLVAVFGIERPRPVAILLDNSLSMNQRDQRLTPQDRMRVALAENLVAPETAISEEISLSDVPAEATADPARLDIVRRVLAHPRLQLLEGLNAKGPLEAYVFGHRLRQLAETGDSAAALTDAIKASEPRTALADALKETLRHREGGTPAAIVVFTDGRDNASRITLEDAARECAKLSTPLHIYGVGTPEIGNLQLKDAAVPDRIFYDDAVAVPIRWRSQGFKSGSAEITLSLAGKVVASKQVTVREGDEFRDVLTFTPRRAGPGNGPGSGERQQLIAAIKYKGTETFLDDNQVVRPVRLSDRKVRILYVENTPRWEYKFLMQTLLRDRRVDASVTLVAGDPRALQSGPPYVPGFPATRQDLFAYDLLILGDVPAGYLTTDRLGWIRDFVTEGGGLVMIAGRQHAPAEFHGTPLAELLPVEFTPKDAKTLNTEAGRPFAPLLTSFGDRSEMLALADTPAENREAWKGLEPIQWHYPVTKLRPGAVALLVHPSSSEAQPAPVLASHNFGKGVVLFLGTDETWRWRYNTRDKYYARFWGQVAYQLGLPHLMGNLKRVQIELERSEPTLGQAGHVFVRLLDSDYRPLALDRLTARLELRDPKPGQARSQSLTLEAVGDQPGEYQALLPHDVLGRFVLKLDGPEPALLEYEVKLPPHHELAEGGMNETALREAARLSGGKFYREEDLHHLASDIKPQTATISQRREILLWNPLTLLLFVGLVTAEWVLRKFSNLS